MNRPYAIIGAGPSGLATAKVLTERGIDFIGFESHSTVGGMWDVTNTNSVVYNSAHLISSKLRSQFSEFPMPESWPEFLPHRLVKQYLTNYASEFGLEKRFTFNSEIVSATRLPGGGWGINTKAGTSHEVAGLFLASGPYIKPNMPRYPGRFAGEMSHSRNYKDPSLFKDKRVLIVGLGNTACDIAVDAIPFATRVHVSAKSSNYFIPKLLMGKPVDQLQSGRLPKALARALSKNILRLVHGKVESYGLPTPTFEFLERHPVLNSLILHHIKHGDIEIRDEIARYEGKQVTFKSGRSDEYDLIFMATGYLPTFSYLAPEHLALNNEIPDFYLKIFHPSYDDLFIIGLVESLGFGWQGRKHQVSLAVDFIECQRRGRTEALEAFARARQTAMQHPTDHGQSIFIDKALYEEQLEAAQKLFAVRPVS